MRRTAVPLLLVLALVVSALLTSHSHDGFAQGRDDDFQQKKSKYLADLERPSLYIRTRSAKRLAATGDERALDMLIGRYLRPENEGPDDHIQYTTASIVTEYFAKAQYVEKLDEWADRCKKDPDGWLWFRTLSVHARVQGTDYLVETATDHRNEFIRVAAIEALAIERPAAALALIPKLMDDLPRRGLERAMIIEACASGLNSAREQSGTPAFRAAALPVISALGEDKTEERTKLVIARHLQAALDTPKAGLDPRYWLSALDGRAMQEAAGDAYARQPTFIGIEGAGTRIAYVIDMSDSMLTPLSVKEKEDLKGVITGGPAPDPEDEDKLNLPWEEIRNRFDAAREFLKLSLRGLPEEAEFTVVFFGTEAKVLDSMGGGLLQAKERHVERVIRELDAVRPGPTETNRPYGTLRGFTNLHGGLLRAFQVADNRLLDKYEHVDKKAMEKGVDTIFVLSDGAPSWDDFDAVDDRDPEDRAGDPEAGTSAQNTPQLHYYGPYVVADKPHYLLTDVQRMNLFRKVQIHCVGIGEADASLLREIVRIGVGKLRRIGAGDDE